MSSLVIEVNNVSKAYPVYSKNSDLLKELITGKKRHDEYWALKNVSFSLKEKQRIGIIGANGSGKSTLLKIITGHLMPTAGSVTVRGQISAMLSLSTVLNAEETGISNIRFNLLLNGCKKAQIDCLVEEVIEFAELGSFIYAPVKTYSSGMGAKLAFAICTSIEPEILVIDEVLSVGDSYFVGKATQRMKELCDRGKALLFVSHSDAAVRMLCDTVIWMENGSIRMIGPVEQVLAAYEEDYRRSEDELTRVKNRERSQSVGVSLGQGDCDENFNRLRLVAANAKRHFEDSHYVRRVAVGHNGGELIDIPLTLEDTATAESDSASRLDVFGSQWGRIFGFHDVECRLLTPRSGRSAGGHVLIGALTGGHTTTIVVEAKSSQGKEFLSIEFADLANCRWTEGLDLSRQVLEDGWLRYTTNVSFPDASSEQRKLARSRIEEDDKPAVEIVDVELLVGGSPASLVKERVPFEIMVGIHARDVVRRCDVGLKIMRGDGVFCFWQSSGLNGKNIEDVKGSEEVVFQFAENPFGAGEYTVTSYVADGWEYPANYPYSEVFDRKVAVLTFRVVPELPDIYMGCVNIRASIQRRRNSEGS